MKRVCLFLLAGLMAVSSATAATLTENFSTNPLQDGGARLELRCLDHTHKDHGQVVNLAWRNV